MEKKIFVNDIYNKIIISKTQKWIQSILKKIQLKKDREPEQAFFQRRPTNDQHMKRCSASPNIRERQIKSIFLISKERQVECRTSKTLVSVIYKNHVQQSQLLLHFCYSVTFMGFVWNSSVNLTESPVLFQSLQRTRCRLYGSSLTLKWVQFCMSSCC